MKNLKPSQLPEGTVIDDEKHGKYIKCVNGFWEEMRHDKSNDAYRLVEDLFRISDSGFEPGTRGQAEPWCDSDLPSDDYFTEYKVIAVPPTFDFSRVRLHGLNYDLKTGLNEDGTGIHLCKKVNCDA